MEKAKVAVALLLVVALLTGCTVRCPRPVRVEEQGGEVSQADIDAAWQQALRVFGGDPRWECPVGPGRVIVVPASLVIDGTTFYGITVWEPTDVNGVIQMVPTVEIHLRDNMRCHTVEVLIHEMGHLILTRRFFTDPGFEEEAAEFESQEEMVRALWPPGEMGICP